MLSEDIMPKDISAEKAIILYKKDNLFKTACSLPETITHSESMIQKRLTEYKT